MLEGRRWDVLLAQNPFAAEHLRAAAVMRSCVRKGDINLDLYLYICICIYVYIYISKQTHIHGL